jgi:hypothetical protein
MAVTDSVRHPAPLARPVIRLHDRIRFRAAFPFPVQPFFDSFAFAVGRGCCG